MQHHHFNIMNRRSFLSTAGKAGLAAALASVTNVPGVLKRAMAEGTIGTGKKVLFIWLRGANDSLNSVVPVLDPAYATSRPTIGQRRDATQNYAAANLPCYDATQMNGAAVRTSTDDTYSYRNAIPLGNGFAALHPSLKFLESSRYMTFGIAVVLLMMWRPQGVITRTMIERLTGSRKPVAGTAA